MTRLILMLGLAGVLFVAVACGGGDENETVSQVTPLPEPTIVGTEINFPARGYRAEFPEGWTADPNIVRGGNVTYDAFFAPEEIEGVQPNITIAREELPEELDLLSYVDEKVSTIRGLGSEDVTVSGPVEVAGQEASVVDHVRRDQVRLDRRDVIFVTEGFGWTISLTVPEGQRDQFLPLLDNVLASFDLRETEES